MRAGEDAAHLVRAVRADDAIHRLARIPNLLTMMALIHRIEATLPDGRALLYERIAEAYLESIDKYRGVYSGAYNLPQKRRWLARVGYEMQKRRSRGVNQNNDADVSELLVDSDKVISWLRDEMQHSTEPSVGMSAEQFLDFVGRRSGLFLPRSEGRYAFVHLSFQEYFAAVALEDEVTGIKWARGEPTRLGIRRETLSEQAGQSAWSETFSFLFELLAPKADWHADLLDAIFGRQFSKVGKQRPIQSIQSVLKILTRLVVNQHSGLNSEKKESAITAAVRTILRYGVPRPEYSRYPPFLFGDLFREDSDWNSKIVRNIAQQAKEARVTSLCFSFTRISELDPLAGLTELKSLDLRSTKISDLGPLAGLTALQFLDLAGAQVLHLNPLAGLTALKALDLDGTQVADIGPLAGLTALVSLDLDGTQVLDIGPLASLTALKSLDLVGTKVSDLAPLAGLTALESLDLRDTQVSDLNPLAGLTALVSLDLDGTNVVDIGPLADLMALDSLDLRGTHVSDLGPLSGLTALENLVLWDSSVTDLGPLAGLTALRTLDLDGTQVSDFGPLAGLTGLRLLDLRRTAVSKSATDDLNRALPECNIQV